MIGLVISLIMFFNLIMKKLNIDLLRIFWLSCMVFRPSLYRTYNFGGWKNYCNEKKDYVFGKSDNPLLSEII